MKPPTKIQEIIWFIQDIPLKIRQVFCRHHIDINLVNPVKDGWKICNGSASCDKCYKNFNYHADLITS